MPACRFELELDESTVVSSYAEPGREGVPGCTSWQQAVQYIDELPAKADTTVRAPHTHRSPVLSGVRV